MLLGQQLSERGAWDLRHTLLNENRIMLLATAISRFEAIDRDAWAWMHRGLLAYELDDYESAIRALQRSLKLKPKLSLACRFLAHCYHDTGEYEKCEQALRTAIEIGGKPGTARAWSRLAELLHNHLNRLDEAEQATRLQFRPRTSRMERCGRIMPNFWSPLVD
jgi:tetratricopeptide (TPR) repeat protein